MKKPNTIGENEHEDEWQVLRLKDDSLVVVCDGLIVCSMNPLGKSTDPNADAISAVPEMIDALCTAYQSIKTLEENQNLFVPAKTRVKEALEKAGVEFQDEEDACQD